MSTAHVTLRPRNTPFTGWTRRGYPPAGVWFARGMVGTLILLSGTAIAPCAAKADVTYNLSTPPFTGGSISGTLTTTTGATGTLSAGSFSSWDIIVNITTSPASTFTLTNLNSTISSLLGVTATLTQLTITQSSIPAQFTIQESSTGPFVIWSFLPAPPPTNGFYGGGIDANAGTLSVVATSGIASPYTIATAQTAAAVPEPSTAIGAVFGAVAFIAYGWSRHRREQRQQGPA